MPNPHKAELKRLEKQVSDLSNALAKLGNASDFKKLILILRRPGWTTPAELEFASAIVESMSFQVAQLSVLKGRLFKAASDVGAS